MANGHGGSRKGAGRKPTPDLYEKPVRGAENALAEHLPAVARNLIKLADGAQQTEETWEPAGTVMIEDWVQEPSGKLQKTKKLAFPNLPPEQLVLVQRKVVDLAPHYSANAYILDRLGGKPVEKVEMEIEDVSTLTDEERADRALAILERARARRDGGADGSQSEA